MQFNRKRIGKMVWRAHTIICIHLCYWKMALWKRRQKQHYWNSLLMGASHRYTNHCHNQNKLNENGRKVRWVIKSGWLNCVNFMASILQYRFSSQQVNDFTRIIKISDGTTEFVIRCSKNWWLLIWIMRPNEWTNRMEKRELANTLTFPAVCICVVVVVVVHWNQIDFIYFSTIINATNSLPSLFKSTYSHQTFCFIRSIFCFALFSCVVRCFRCCCSFFFPRRFMCMSLLFFPICFVLYGSVFFREKWRTPNHFTPNNILELVSSVFMVMMMILSWWWLHGYVQHSGTHTNRQ